ncbi:unnamed protein product [Bursaphelenchus xylophilus]|uniref:(pine wood nematode) hypothetical protein n=1 Tax=Bursaphelenchus xylophilus TaxID=6326 RepID=A0A1I7S9L8_BURXY|nr:unnamed protein product [Bursaphelenchus xylophilus]CAG9131938.1 unnamed protein product [Bursaphelenchus xylophilus]
MEKENKDPYAEIREIFNNFFKLRPVAEGFRSHPPHHGGAFNPTRLFGGQATAQAYLAATKIRQGFVPLRMSSTFLRPGVVQDPYDYVPSHASFGSYHLGLDCVQNGKVMNSVHFRMTSSKFFRREASQPISFINTTNIPCPLSVPECSPFLATVVMDQWLERHGFQPQFKKFNFARGSIFEMRLIRFFDFKVSKSQTTLLWMRLSKTVREFPVPTKMMIPLVFSDFIIGLPIDTIADASPGEKLGVMSSMEHQVVFHSDEFDPTDFFLIEQMIEFATDMVKIQGKIATKEGKPVLSFTQQAFFQDLIPNEPLKSVPRL